jgi:hypothetical protein
MDFVATLLTAVLHRQRLLWSRQIEDSSDRLQSVPDLRPAAFNDSKAPSRGSGSCIFDSESV